MAEVCGSNAADTEPGLQVSHLLKTPAFQPGLLKDSCLQELRPEV